MNIDFSSILLVPGKVLDVKAKYEKGCVGFSNETYKTQALSDIEFSFKSRDRKHFSFTAKGKFDVTMPCSRCLDDVVVPAEIDVERFIDLSKNINDIKDESDEYEDYSGYIRGTELDVDAFISCEILSSLPMKVLCKDDCKGLCPKCGKNLNHGACNCEEKGGFEPEGNAFAKALDIYNSYFKEV